MPPQPTDPQVRNVQSINPVTGQPSFYSGPLSMSPAAGGVPSPTTPMIDAASLNNPNTMTLPQANPNEQFNSLLAASNSIPMSIEDAMAAAETTTANAPQMPEEKTQQTISDRLLSAYNKLTGKQGAQLQAEEKAGLPGFQSQLTDINSQLQTLSKEAAAIPLQIQNEVTGRGVTAGGAAPMEIGRLRVNTIQRLGLSAVAQTLQGNIATAQATANRAVEIEFAPIQAEIDALSKAYEINKDTMDRKDKKRSEALQINLQERQRLLDDMKENKNIIYGWTAEAAKNGAPATLVNQALSASDPTQALQILSQYFQDPIEKEQSLTDLALKREQLRQAPLAFETDQKVAAANIRQSDASAASSRASAAKSDAEIKAMQNAPAGTISQVTGKPLTEGERTSLGYAARATNSDKIVADLGSKFTARTSITGQMTPNIFKSEDRQKYEQAQRDFINAVLRKESGAVISPEEFDNARQQYFPQPGDQAGVVLQKSANRQQTINNLLVAGGTPAGGASTQTIPKGTDGAAYGHPGYVSDGTQWVQK